jgi:hypothetical protein
MTLTAKERQRRPSAGGKVTPLVSGEITTAMELEKADLVFLVRDGTQVQSSPRKARRLFAGEERAKKKLLDSIS